MTTSDVLVLTVPLRIGLGYPTANQAGANGHRAGAKSPAYKALVYDLEEQAKAAVDAGWEMAVYPVRFSVTYYRPDRSVVDAGNLGSCELNCLTRTGVWADDELARPVLLDYQPGSPGEPRVVVVVQRLAPPAGTAPRAPRPRTQPKAETPLQQPATRSGGRSIPGTYVGQHTGGPIPHGMVLVNGELWRMTSAEAIAYAMPEKKK